MSTRRILIWSAAGLSVALFAVNRYVASLQGRTFTGVVLLADPDPKKQFPIAQVQVSAPDLLPGKEVMSNSSGSFQLGLIPGIRPGQLVRLRLRHPDYETAEVAEPAGLRPHVFRLRALRHEDLVEGEEAKVSGLRVRYTVRSEAMVNVGSAVKTFEIMNTGGVRCFSKTPCSPDGRWQAAISGASLDAGDGNEFLNARVACIAGPCVYTQIENDGFTKGGRVINVTVRNWADTATYLLAAEVARQTVRNETQMSYPVVYGRALSFILPPAAQGPSIRAEMDGMEIVYPLDPGMNLSWANCSSHAVATRSTLYQCELKPGYRFP